MISESEILEQLKPCLLSLERHRKHFKKKELLARIFTFTLIGSVLLTIFIFKFHHSPSLFFIIILMGSSIFTLIALHQISNEKKWYSTYYKRKVISEILDKIEPQLMYREELGITIESFAQSELFSEPARYSSEDLISGKYGKTEIELAEIHTEDIERRTDSEGNTEDSYITRFKGVLFIADFHKNFHGRTFVLPDIAENTLGHMGRLFQKVGGRPGSKLVQMDDPEFEKHFAIYSDDEVECRYILSNAMMEGILKMKKRVRENDIRIAFKDSSVFIGVPYKKGFLEPQLNISATNTEQIKSFISQISSFTSIIEELNLNTRIWTKD